MNGYGKISTDPKILEIMDAKWGTLPLSALIVHVEEAYLHCAKAILRSKLWNRESQYDRENLSPGPTIISDHSKKDSDEYAEYYQNAMEKMLEDEGHK